MSHAKRLQKALAFYEAARAAYEAAPHGYKNTALERVRRANAEVLRAEAALDRAQLRQAKLQQNRKNNLLAAATAREEVCHG